MKPRFQLREIANALQQMDVRLREQGNCETCGKPKSGIVRAGQTVEQAGICTCDGEPSPHPDAPAASGRE